MKKGPLSGKDKDYIKLNYKAMQVFAMAEKLKRSFASVQKFVDELVEEEPPKQEEPAPADAHSLYARKAERGVIASTQAASMAADESRAKKEQNPISPRYNKFIHKIKK